MQLTRQIWILRHKWTHEGMGYERFYGVFSDEKLGQEAIAKMPRMFAGSWHLDPVDMDKTTEAGERV